MKNRLFLLTFVLSLPLAIFAQDDAVVEEAVWAETGTLAGMVTDVSSGAALPGANVVVEGTDLGAAADASGSYLIENVPAGSYTVTTSVIGYKSSSESVTVGTGTAVVNFSLAPVVLQMSGLEVLASRAGEKTAVAYTDIRKEDLELRLGSRDIPLALNTVPSVYATGQGGGAGDARINVRGFDQRNVAIMINGVPVNDMENGWVYWSNWDGVADATSSIQMQKGLSAVNLATPSIGGSMNVITDPTATERRGLFKQETGAWGFSKSTFSFHSGLLMDDKLALSATLVTKKGDGFMQGTWTDAQAYYFGASYSLSNEHRFEFYALGAPQRHGQNLYKQNMAVYNLDYAQSLEETGTYNNAALASNGGEFREVGPDFNQNVSNISSASQDILDNAGGQHWQMYNIRDGVDRHEAGLLNERENFFHKPQVNLNHYWTINDKMRLISGLYWSGGMGGGTGTYGTIVTADANGTNDQGTAESNGYKYYYGPSPWIRDWDATIAINSAPAGMAYAYKREFDRGNKESIGILRNSNNRQSTIGLISKLDYNVSENLQAQVGLDWRSAEIYHVKTIRDLLGGTYFVNTDSEFDADGQQKGLGNPIDYNFTNNVNWLGFFGQGQYTMGALSAYGMVGMTTVKYIHQNHFKKAENYSYSYVESADGSGMDHVEGNGDDMGGNPGELKIVADPITTTQFKAGVLYSLGDAFSSIGAAIPVVGKLGDNAALWANFGVVDKAPTFDQVIQDWDAKMASDPKNEKFTAFEFGLNTGSSDGTMFMKLNYYNTTWTDRIQTKYIVEPDGDDNIIYMSGINQTHSGIEAEIDLQVHSMLGVNLGLSKGNWLYTDDATGKYRDPEEGADVSYSYALKDLRIGDQPQTTLLAGLTVTPTEGATIQALLRNYRSHFAQWSPGAYEYSEGDTPDRAHPWQAPDYSRVDLHATYDIPGSFAAGGTEVTLQAFVHVFNALDEVYIQDAVDNSNYNAWDKNHGPDDAEVFFGLPRSFNAGIAFNF